jgi:hypothetical protein
LLPYGFILGQQNLGPFDIGLLPLLRAPDEQDDENIAVLRKVEPVTRPPVDAIFAQTAADPFDVRRVAGFQPERCGRDLGRNLRIEVREPRPERA